MAQMAIGSIVQINLFPLKSISDDIYGTIFQKHDF